jgi:excisionase family DNA binding protein
MDKLLLTSKEVAEAMGVGRSKVYELMAAGLLPSVKIGKSRRVPVDALEAYIGQLRTDVGAA